MGHSDAITKMCRGNAFSFNYFCDEIVWKSYIFCQQCTHISDKFFWILYIHIFQKQIFLKGGINGRRLLKGDGKMFLDDRTVRFI